MLANGGVVRHGTGPPGAYLGTMLAFGPPQQCNTGGQRAVRLVRREGEYRIYETVAVPEDFMSVSAAAWSICRVRVMQRAVRGARDDVHPRSRMVERFERYSFRDGRTFRVSFLSGLLRRGIQDSAFRPCAANSVAVLAWCLFLTATAHAQNDDFRLALAADATGSAWSFGTGGAELARSVTLDNGFRSDCWDNPPPDTRISCHPKDTEGDETTFRIFNSAGGVETPTTVEKNYAYSTVARTATEGVDYEAASGTLTMKVGDSTTRRVSIPLLEDSLDEPEEIFAIHVVRDGHTGNFTGGYAELYIVKTIVDNDGAMEAAIANASGVEDTVGKLTFDVALNTASAQVITLNYATTDGTATAGSDYTGTRGTVTFAAGETTKTIDVPVLEDGTPEEDETFTVTLSDAVNATIGDGTGTGTIQDDDPVPASLSIGDVVAVESRAALEFPVMLSGERGEMTTVTVDYATANRTAEAGRDYTETTGSLTFAIDVTQQTIRVPLLDDVIDETHEIFEVRLSNAMGALVGDARAEGTILDDDFASREITLTASPARVSEDDGATDIDVTAMLDGAARTSAIEVSVSVAGSGNAGAVDFVEVQDFTITIAALHNGGTATFTLTPINDEVDELDETLSVTGMSFLTVNGTEVELTDDDAMSSGIALTADPPRVSEGDGATPVRVTATLDAGARTEATTVTVTVSGSGDSDAVDFGDVQDFTITFAAGVTSGTGTFTLTPIDDDVDESDETLTVRGNSDLPVTEDTVELADDDQPSAAIVLSARPRRIAEDGGARAVRVRATLDASARTVATTVTVSVADSGQPDAVDYVATPTAFDITIAAGATSGIGRFTVTPEDDDIDERDEVLRISGTSDLQVMPTSVTVTLADDEATSMEILLSAVPSTVSEGAGATEVEITATLDAGARTVATTVTASATGSGDPGAVDFAAVQDFTILIAAGATSGRETFTLTPEDDNVVETSETLAVVGNADLLVTRTSVTLTDDDVGSNGIVLSASPALVSEGGGAVPVTVTASLDGAVRQAATTVTVSVAGSGNAQTVDFQAVPDFEITIAANAASGSNTFTLTPEDDGTAEVDETLDLTGTSDLPVTPTVVTLADDDDPSTRILLSAVPERVSEGDGPTPVTVTATLDRALRQTPTPVTVSVSGSGDPDAVDLLAVPDFALTIPANAASGTGTFTLTPEDDAAVEVDEQVTVSGASDLPVTRTAVTLVDDDEVSTRILLFLTVDPPRASEGDGAVRVAVTAAVDTGVRPDETRIRVSVAGGGDPDAVDFVAVPDFDIAISANARNGTATFTVVPEDDLIVEADETLTVSGVSDLPVTPATMELLDDDEASRRILLSAVPARVSEGDGPVAVTVTASVDRGLRQQATDGDGVGIGQRRSGRGGLRPGGGLRDHHRGGSPERHRDVHADAGGRRGGRGGRDAGADGRIGPAGDADVGGPGGRRRDGERRAVDRRCFRVGERGRRGVRGDARRPEPGGGDGALCDGGPVGVRGSGRRSGHGLRERVGDADVRSGRVEQDAVGLAGGRRDRRADRDVRHDPVVRGERDHPYGDRQWNDSRQR